MYSGSPTNDDLAALGLPGQASKSFEEEACSIWPCNWKTVQLFVAMGTQWRIGMGGPTGLDYATLPVVAESLRIKLTPARFDGVRVMEGEALRVMGEERKKPSKP